jgi:serine/threonine protein kinase/Tfp pilus assembly protein PilF
MNAERDDPEFFPGVDAAGALRAGFARRHRASAEPTHGARTEPRARSSDAGGYELQGEIARGGMGVIVRARDRELGRDVALKVLRDDLAIGDAGKRFEHRFLEEARVTACLDHPGIVPVHEVGRDAHGRAYFAMRLVRGRELKRIIELAHASSEGWNRTRALTVIQKVCEAMAYAHEKGVIHRDLKPSNVMVGEFGEVYVMDWGLARRLDADDAHDLRLRETGTQAARGDSEGGMPPPERERDRFERARDRFERERDRLENERDRSRALTTDADARSRDIESPIVTMDGEVLGTPCYMSPEQARGRIAELGPRSDIYSVGAMLYHLLAGQMPYVPTGTSVASRQVLLSLVQGPPRALDDLRADIPSELVAITEKAMARQAENRYPSMLAMADDLRAFLERRVVSAYETGTWAEAKKWVQRNKALSAAMSLAVIALAVGLVVSLTLKAQSDASFARAEQSARVASDERDRALKIASFLEDTLHGVAPSVALGRDTTMLREMMDDAWSRIEKGELAAAPEAELRLMLVIGESYDEIAQLEKAELALGRASARAESLYSGDHPLLARAHSQLGHLLHERGDLAHAEPLVRAAVEMRRRLFPGDNADVAESLAKLGTLLRDKGDLAGGAAAFREALEMRERLVSGDHESTALAANNLGATLHSLGDLDGAEKLLRRAVEMQERLYKGDHPLLASSIDNLAALSADRGDTHAAEDLHRRSLEMRRRLFAGDHLSIAESLNNLALAMSDNGKHSEAEALERESLAMRRRLSPGDNLDVANSLTNLAAMLYLRGDLAGAEPLYREALDMMRRVLPGDHPMIATILGNLGVLLKKRGELEQAEALYREELAIERRLYPGDHPDLATALNNLASLLEIRGDLAGAESNFREALAMQQRLAPGDSAKTAAYQDNLAKCLRLKGDQAEAESLHRDVLEMRKRLSDAEARGK